MAEPLSLSEQPRPYLNGIAQSRSLPAGLWVHFAAIKVRLETTAPSISRWKQRFLEDGLEGWTPIIPDSRRWC
jgi:hypothetical protein